MKHINKIRHFTLVEIMTVIVIAAILFAIGIPAFSTMIQGNNMTVAVRQLSAKIQAARAYAVTNRCKVAVLLLSDYDEEENPSENDIKDAYKKDNKKANPDYCFSAYRVCIVSDDSNAFQEWIADEDWKTLPKGIFRDSVSGTVGVSGVDTTSVGGDGVNDGGSKPIVRALLFKKNGQLENAGKIVLQQGRYLPKIGKIPTGKEKDTVNISQYTGKITVTVDPGD